ncbi:efflux transporter periplasmic adaptor subunit [Bacteroides heparinolyticus]|uniref:efflux RND transporter periplasmic adaptor subunit n=1 Tax=Prevotella heparinolytica TaxID=28113 RepID=UPI000D035312|nr:efflux RND transporter periplasmic adaptor subunit [Bacteroides heparinolyticus]AVM57351.1 efflux transporter periplasmic adaptor subunit [Bacteroides heparinolyticus]
MKTKKYLKIALLVVVAALFIWTFVFLYQKSRPKVVVYETVIPEVTDLEKTTVATGKVEPRDEVLIKPQISGIISEIYKVAGQSIKKNEVIAKVKVIPELGTLNSAESRVRLAGINATQAETDFARTQKLYKDKLISAEEYEKGEVAVRQAREELQTAKDNLEIVKEGITKNSASFSSTLIRSTIDGLILDVPIKVGNSVIMSNTLNDGTTIASVANMNDLIFRGNIDETEVGRVHEGMSVKLTIGALQNLSFNAILEYISPKGVEQNGANQFEIKAAISAPDSVQIRSGYSANAEIVLERAQKVLALPESTVEFSGDSTFVYVMTDSIPAQKFERRPIKVGMSDGIKIAIKSGITAKDKIRGAEKKDK